LGEPSGRSQFQVVRWYTVAPGGTDVLKVAIDGDVTVVSAVPQTVPSEIETLLRGLVGKLLASSRDPHETYADVLDDEEVLLDVDVGGVRLLALRGGQQNPITLLSPREQEIARMVASGYPNKTIASVLEISSWTVASHLRRIFMKLQVSSRAAMATRLSGPSLGELPTPGGDLHERISPVLGSPRRNGI
jgi:DNA-binding CsgD family transcriptional regulator